MTKQSYLRGALILVLASVIVKGMGFLYQMMVVRLIGTEGIGVFNMIYPLYITAMILTTAGLPLAVSKFVAEEAVSGGRACAEKILGMAVAILLVLSLLGSFLLILASPALIRFLYADPRVIPAFLILLPTLLMIGLSSALRSYFQGLQDMRPTANTQLIEQSIRFCSGLTLVYFLYPYGLVWSAVGLAVGVLLSEIGGLVYLVKLYKKVSLTGKFLTRPTIAMTSRFFSFGIPIAVTRIILTIVSAIEASLIPRQLLKAGKTLSEAASFYGELTGVAFTLLSIPSTLSFSLATTLVPAISEALSKKNRNALSQRTADALGITLIAGIPSAIILYNWGPDMASLLFNASNAGILIKTLSLGSVFLYLAQTSSGILQGTGNVKISFATSFTGGVIRLAGIYFLGASPGSGVVAISASYAVSYTIVASLNLLFIKIKTGFSLEGLLYLRLAAAGFALVKLLEFTKPLAQTGIPALVLLTMLNVLLFFLILLITGDKYSRLIIKQLTRSKKQ